MLVPNGMSPIQEGFRAMREGKNGDDGDNGIQEQIDGDQNNRNADRLFESFKKDTSKSCKQKQRNEHLAGQPMGSIRIVHEVRRRVGSRQCHGDDEVSRSKSQEDENKRLTAPFWKELFQHRDRA